MHIDDVVAFKKIMGIVGSFGSLETSLASAPPLAVVASGKDKLHIFKQHHITKHFPFRRHMFCLLNSVVVVDVHFYLQIL